EVVLSRGDPPLSELGLALRERHRYHTDRFLSLGQPPGNCGLAAWRIAWHSAHLRRSRSWLFGLAGADKLTPVPASVRARQSRPALPANRHRARQPHLVLGERSEVRVLDLVDTSYDQDSAGV